MKEFLNRFLTNHRWFLGTMIALVILILFFWRLVDHEGYVHTINGFFHDLWEIFKGLLALVIAGVGIAMMLGWRPFRKKGNGH